MGWFIRKSFQVGPLRLNLSKGGVGISAGVKGFRVGTGPRGPYVAGGRGGLYFRDSLKPPGCNRPKRPLIHPHPLNERPETRARSIGSGWLAVLSAVIFLAGIGSSTPSLIIIGVVLGMIAGVLLFANHKDAPVAVYQRSEEDGTIGLLTKRAIDRISVPLQWIAATKGTADAESDPAATITAAVMNLALEVAATEVIGMDEALVHRDLQKYCEPEWEFNQFDTIAESRNFLQAFYERHGHELRAVALKSVRLIIEDLDEYDGTHGTSFADEGREMFLRLATAMASAKGQITDRQQELLTRLQEALRTSPSAG